MRMMGRDTSRSLAPSSLCLAATHAGTQGELTSVRAADPLGVSHDIMRRLGELERLEQSRPRIFAPTSGRRARTRTAWHLIAASIDAARMPGGASLNEVVSSVS